MSIQQYPERLRYYTVHRDKGYTIICDPNNNHESIEYSTDMKEIKKAYSPLILHIDPTPPDNIYPSI